MWTDPHCTSSSEFSKPTDDGLTEYLQLFMKSFEFVKNLAYEMKPDIMVFGGDFWDARDYIDTMSVNVGQRMFSMMSEIPGISHKYAVIGNHDYYSVKNNIHTLHFLRDLGWTLFEDTGVVSLGKYTLAGVPFRDKYDLAPLAKINELKADVVLTHLDVIGGMRRAPKNEHDTKAYSENGIPRDVFKDCGMVLNGHYHHPSQVADNWYNVGSLTSRTFHDKDSAPRGAVIYDLETKEYIRCPNPHAYRFTDVYLHTEEDVEEAATKDWSKTYARLHYNLDLQSDAEMVKELFAGARMLPVAPKVDFAVKEEQVDFDARFSLLENLENYLKAHYEDEELIQLAIEIFEEASQEYKSSSSREILGFGKLDIRNFQAFRHAELDLRGPGLVFVRGVNDDDPGENDNGSGKSTLLEAIYWVLTGKSLRGFKSNEVIGWHSDWCRVSLELHVANHVYTVVRSRKCPDYGTGVTLLAGDLDAGARLPSDTQIRLEDLIGRSEKNLLHTCFLLDGMKHRFSALSEEQRFKMVEDILDCEPYRLACDISKKRLEKIGLDLYELRGEAKAYEAQRERAESSVADIKADIKYQTSDDRAVTLREKRDRDQAHLLKYEEVLLSDKDTAECLAHQISDLDKKIASFEEQVHSIVSDGKEPARVVAKYETLIAQIFSLEGKHSCPTCMRPIEDGFVSETLAGYESAVEEPRKHLSEIEELASKVRKRITVLRAKSAEMQSQYRVKLSAIDSLGAEMNRLGGSILRDSKELDDLDNVTFRLKDKLRDTIKLRDDAEHNRKKVEDAIASAKAWQDRLDTLFQDVFDRTGVRAALLSQTAIPFMNLRLQEYSQDAYGGKSIQIDDSLQLKFTGNHTYKSNSRGQKRRVDFLMQFVLSDLSSATGAPIEFLGLDEVLDSLDDSGIYAVKEVLRKKSEEKTVLVISHNKYAAAIVPRQIVVTKRDGISSITEDSSKASLMEG